MMQYNVIAIQYIDDNGSKKVYQPKGYLSHRPKEKRWMGRFRKIDRKEKCVYAKTQKECKILLNEAIEEYCKELQQLISSGQALNRSNQINNNSNNQIVSNIPTALSKNMTLKSCFDFWLNTFKKPKIKISTYNHYVEIFSRYTEKPLGNHKISELSSSLIQDHLNKIPAPSGKKKIHQILKEMYDFLQKQNIIKVNPMLVVVLPKTDLDKVIDEEGDEILLYRNEKILFNALSKNGNKNKYYYIIKVGLYSGLRRGELLGLQWKHIDFEKKFIYVRQQLNMSVDKQITSVKTNAAIRNVPMLPQAEEALLELFKNQSAEEFVFQDCLGMNQKLSLLSRILGFRVNPHMLRHTFISRCYAAGLDPKRIQTIVGHETVDITLNTYTHVLEKDDLEVIQMMRDFYIEKGLILKLD